MIIINQSHEIIDFQPETILKKIETAARTCYRSQDSIGDIHKTEKFVQTLVKNGHGAMLEFADITVKFVTDRGVSHEMVRHRLCSFAQESTRYCNYGKYKFGKELTFIRPPIYGYEYLIWHKTMKQIESTYMEMIRGGMTPQIARSVLPCCLKTEIVVKANIREWMHIIAIRTTPKAHPQISDLIGLLRVELAEKLPILFGGPV
ncbi:MAG: FAD-dependent thymidylate synthase [Chloroflexi bacterium]|nr:MAG: FAD-dependent thymidylate synthase [Chloroflexota bacterium]